MKRSSRITLWSLLAFVVIFVLVAYALLNMSFGLCTRKWYYERRVIPSVRRCKHSPIPHIIHQTWKTTELLPFQQKNLCRWKRSLPETFQFKLYVDSDFDAFVHEHFEWFWPTWESLNPFIKKVDAIRYMWLYVYGGVYVDLDLELWKPAEFLKLINHSCPEATAIFTSNSTLRPFIKTSPALMMSHPGHDIWLRMLEYIRDHVDVDDVLYYTGPNALSYVVRDYIQARERKGNVLLISQNAFGIKAIT
jgi:mannosyltransferase OCH1-like enzyme